MNHYDLSIFEKLQNTLGKAQQSPDKNGDAVFFCPACKHDKPHLVINVKSELYNCWICGFSGKGHIYCLSRLGYREKAELLFSKNNNRSTLELTIESLEKELFGYKKNHANEDEQILMPKNYKQIVLYKHSFLYNVGYNYLIKRHLNDDDIMKFNIHYNIQTRRICIPSYDSSYNLNYYITRTVDDNVQPKYINSKCDKMNIIFNEHLIDWDSELLIVEGIFDSILSRKNSVPILGTSLNTHSKLFKTICKFKTPITISLDSDAYFKQFKIAENLLKNNIVVKMLDLRKFVGQDIASIDNFNEVYTNNIINFGEYELIKSKLRS